MAGVNFPDVLGYITNGKRINNNVVQLASALRPRVVRAGRPFEMLLLVQNASDVALQVTATLKLPDKDAKGQRDRFVTKAGRLIIDLEPAGVGLVILPLSSLPDTAPSADYKIGMDVKMTPAKKEKPSRVRTLEGGAEFDITSLPPERRSQIEDLKKLHWTSITSGSVIESQLTAMSGTVGAFADLKPSWTSLWSLNDHSDKKLVFMRMAPLIKARILPQLTQRAAFPIMLEYTQKRFLKAKYKVKPEEYDMIARLLTMLIMYASVDNRKAVLMSVGKEYNITQYFDDGFMTDPGNRVEIPIWFDALLELVAQDERMADYPIKAVAHFKYDVLLRDAMLHAFSRIEELAGIEIGTLHERNAYIDSVIASLNKGTLDFDRLYMPLVLGGVVVADQVLQKGEKAADLTARMRHMIDARFPEKTADNAATFELTNQLVELSLNRYTMNQW
jgi:hypothetical protein